MGSARNRRLDTVRGIVVFSLGVGFLSAESALAGWLSFRNETGQRLLVDSAMGAADPDEKAYVWGDFDRDGDLDLIILRKPEWTVDGGRPNVLLMNEGLDEGHALQGVLVDRTLLYANAANDVGAGFTEYTNDRAATLVDVDADGWLDLVTAVTLSDGRPKRISHPRVYRNLGVAADQWRGFLYEEDRIPKFRVPPSGISVAPRFGSVAAGDLNQDGFADLYFVNDDAGPISTMDLDDRILFNNRLGSFTDFRDAILPSGVLESSRAASVAIADFDGDGLLDVAKSEAGGNHPGIRISYNNLGQPGVLDRSELMYRGSVVQVAVGDLNGDHRPDIVASHTGTDRFFLNEGPGVEGFAQFSEYLFSHDSAADDGPGGNVVISDLDNDGRNDVIITDVDPEFPGCFRRLHLYRNLGGVDAVQLEEQGGEAPWTARGVHDVAAFDINGDDWNDLVLGTCEGTQLWINVPAMPWMFTYPEGLPSRVPPRTTQAVIVEILANGPAAPPAPSAAILHLSVNGGAFSAIPMAPHGSRRFRAILPAIGCGTTLRWYISAESGPNRMTDPPGAPESTYRSFAGSEPEIQFRDELEGNVNLWIIQSFDVEWGTWERAVPIGTFHGSRPSAPGQDATRGNTANKAFVTDNGFQGSDVTRRDVDGGPTYLLSPRLNLTHSDALVSFKQWLYCDDRNTPKAGDADELEVHVSADDGANWVPVTATGGTDGQWQTGFFRVADYIQPSSMVRVRFGISDNPNNSITEGGIDDFQVMGWSCEPSYLAVIDSDPPSGAVDARQPRDPNGTDPQGWDTIDLVLNQPAEALLSMSFSVAFTGAGGPLPAVQSAALTGEDSLRIVLSQPIPPGAWTDLGHPLLQQVVRLGFLPGDVDENSETNPADVHHLLSLLNGTAPQVSQRLGDIDRSGAVSPVDVVRLVDVLTGGGALEAWNGRRLP